MDYLIEIDAVNGPCWVTSGGGDPERTSEVDKAERYSTEREAIENAQAFRSKFPERKYRVVTLADAEVKALEARLASLSGTTLDVALLTELRRNRALLPAFTGMSGEGILKSDIALGTEALLGSDEKRMRDAVRTLTGNKHWAAVDTAKFKGKGAKS